MQEFEFGAERATFFSVGMLREILKKYPDDTPIMMNGLPGEVIEDEHRHILSLEALDFDYDDDAMWMQEPATMGQEYIDF